MYTLFGYKTGKKEYSIHVQVEYLREGKKDLDFTRAHVCDVCARDWDMSRPLRRVIVIWCVRDV